MVFSSSPKGKQSWYSWHLSRLAFLQYGRTEKDAMLLQSDKRGCLVVRLTSSFRTILSTSLLVTAQYSEPYRKIGRMHVLYNFSLVGMVILDLQICLSVCSSSTVNLLSRFTVMLWPYHSVTTGMVGLLCRCDLCVCFIFFIYTEHYLQRTDSTETNRHKQF